jgi:endoglucanase
MDINFLNAILNTHSVSGFENKAGKLFLDYIEQYVDSTDTDIIGNSYANIGNMSEDNSTLKILLEAHIDEIGFQVIYIDDSGFIYIRKNGGIDIQCIPGSQIVIQTSSGEELLGVIGKKPIHLTAPEERNKNIELHTLWIDTGLSPDEVKKKISIGDVVAWQSNVIHLSDKRISSKGLDDKVGVYIISQVLKKLSTNKVSHVQVCGIASVQEEVGHRGAMVCCHKLNPDIAISIDVDFATDVPDCPKTKFGDILLGNGVVIHRSIDNTSSIALLAEKIALENNIKYQISARPTSVGGTNAMVLQQTKGGIRTISLGIPCRYMHTPVELCDLDDIKSAIELLYHFIIEINN